MFGFSDRYFDRFSHVKRQVQDMSFFAFDEEKDRRRSPWRYDAAVNEDTDVDQENDSGEEALNPEDEEERKAPVAVRVLVWAAVVMIFFAIGYWGSGLVINWLDRRGVIRDEQLVQGTDEVRQLTVQEEGKTDTAAGPRSRFRIYVPTNGSFREETVSFVAGLLEDDLKNVLSGLLETYRREG
ncbi:MAG: Lipoprotein LpqB, GerMN domain protein, partial [Synergistales bacterium 53_16]